MWSRCAEEEEETALASKMLPRWKQRHDEDCHRYGRAVSQSFPHKQTWMPAQQPFTHDKVKAVQLAREFQWGWGHDMLPHVQSTSRSRRDV